MEVFRTIGTWSISSSVWISVFQDRRGSSIEIACDEYSIVYRESLWIMLRREVPNMRNDGYIMNISETKDVRVIVINGKRYVTFSSCNVDKNGKKKCSYINLDDDEWSRMLAALDRIDRIIHVNNIARCNSCFNCMKEVSLHNGRMKVTLLSPEAFDAVEEHNSTHHHELAQCEYCAGYVYTPGICHCHQYSCRECEPENFCLDCGAMTIIAI